jgi:hypothetical protein
MKKIALFILMLAVGVMVQAQDFDKNLATARASYTSGDLENTRFAIEQMLGDLDVIIGKEILKSLPIKMGALSYNEKQDNVTGGGGAGLFIHRDYGVYPKSANLEVINNSPLITSINAILSVPMMGAMMHDENQKVVKIQGYKSLLNKSVNTETGKTRYELQVPVNNTLVTLKLDDTNESEITSLGGTIPLAKIVQIGQ